MIRWFSLGILLGAVAVAPAAVAQLPMSPVYRSATETQPSKTDNAKSAATDTAPATAERSPEEHALPAKPEVVEQRPVATAPIPPPPSRDAGKGSEVPATSADPASAAAAHTADTAATIPPPRSAPDSHEGAAGETSSAAANTAATQKPAPKPETPAASTEAPADQAAATQPDKPNKTVTRKDRRQARTRRHARRPSPAYYYPPPTYYARSPYPDRSGGYGGGAYGPSPYSSDGP